MSSNLVELATRKLVVNQNLRPAVSTVLYILSVLILVIVASSGFVLYLGGRAAPITRTSTITSVSLSAACTFSGQLVIIPNGTGENNSLNFAPSTISVVIGKNNTISWFNADDSFHTIAIDSAPTGAQYSTGLVGTAGSYTLTLTIPGTYQYYCEWHPAWMRATIIVKSS